MEVRRPQKSKLDRELGCCSSRRLKCRRLTSTPVEAKPPINSSATTSLLLTSTPLKSPGHRRPVSLEDLPEDLLHRVMSGLTVKEAGRTSVLSSRWRKRWTYHSNLCFDGTSSEFAGYDTDRFVNHVTTVLQQHSGLVVERFELRSPAVLGKEHAHHLDGWFGFVTATKARHATLDLCPPLHCKHRDAASLTMYRLPANQPVGNGSSSSSSCTASTLSLLLGYVCLELPPIMPDGSSLLVPGFKTLKKLELKSVVDLGGLTTLIANCPSLEYLSISNSSVHHLVVPQSRCLRYLRLEHAGLLSINLLNATSLTTFEYLGCPFVQIKTNNDLKQLSQASILLYWGFDTVGYFWDVLSCWLAPVHRLVLAFCMDKKTTRFINNPTKFIHMRHLTLFCNILGAPESALVVLRVTQILESAPQLQYFLLHMESSPLCLKTPKPDSIHQHVHNHLKTVQMTGVLGLSGQLELAKYILLSANALEFMILNLGRNGIRHRSKPDYTHFARLEKLAKEYLDPQGLYHSVLKIVGLAGLGQSQCEFYEHN